MKNQFKNINSNGVKIAIFDMDGTILNTLEDLSDSVNYALGEFGMPKRNLDEVRSFVGHGMKHLIDCAVGSDYSDEIKQQVKECYDQYYKSHGSIKTRPYDGIIDTINELKRRGVKVAVVSNKPDSQVQILCKNYFDGIFDYAVGAKDNIRIKPFPDSVNAVLDYFGIGKDEAIYIGDSDVDYMTAQNAGLNHFIVCWGYRDEDFVRSCGATNFAHKPEDLLEIF